MPGKIVKFTFQPWANDVGKPEGGVVLKIEKENRDGELSLENWTPNPNVPSMIPHDRRLSYSSSGSDQRVVAHDFTPADKPVTLGGGIELNKSFLTTARSREKTVADRIAEEWNKTETYDFRD
jgi:hypothetical protein